MRSFIPSLLVAAGGASAHSIFQELWVNGVSAGHETGIRVPSYDGPITNVTSSDMTCNGGANPLNTPLPTDIIEVAAGDIVTTEWHHTLAGAVSSDSADPIDASHKGPIMVYLAKVDSALTTEYSSLKWFKIYEDGLTGTTWAVDKLITNKGKVNVTIPSCISDGNYLLRAELVALHSASSYPGAQFYMECAQINISGGDGSSSPSTVSFPGAYSGTNPGITFNLYNNPTSYTIPGPSVFSCNGTSSGGNATTNAAVVVTGNSSKEVHQFKVAKPFEAIAASDAVRLSAPAVDKSTLQAHASSKLLPSGTEKPTFPSGSSAFFHGGSFRAEFSTGVLGGSFPQGTGRPVPSGGFSLGFASVPTGLSGYNPGGHPSGFSKLTRSSRYAAFPTNQPTPTTFKTSIMPSLTGVTAARLKRWANEGGL